MKYNTSLDVQKRIEYLYNNLVQEKEYSERWYKIRRQIADLKKKATQMARKEFEAS